MFPKDQIKSIVIVILVLILGYVFFISNIGSDKFNTKGLKREYRKEQKKNLEISKKLQETEDSLNQIILDQRKFSRFQDSLINVINWKAKNLQKKITNDKKSGISYIDSSQYINLFEISRELSGYKYRRSPFLE